MYWNHRVIKHTLPDGVEMFTVREVHYEDKSDKPDAFVLDPEGVQAESLDDLREYCQWMLKAFDLPVLVLADTKVSGEAALKRD
jgi:hypothetical protein